MFFRNALNEGSLVAFLNALKFNQEVTTKYFEPWSIIRSEELSAIFFKLLDSLHALQFRLFLKNPDVNRDDYWSRVLLM